MVIDYPQVNELVFVKLMTKIHNERQRKNKINYFLRYSDVRVMLWLPVQPYL